MSFRSVLLLVLLAATVGCGGHSTLGSNSAAPQSATTLPLVLEVEVSPQAPLAEGAKGISALGETAPPTGLPRPSELLREGGRSASFASDLFFTGNQYADDLPQQRVTKVGENALFSSVYGRESKDVASMAFATYRINLTDYPNSARRQSVKLEWNSYPGMGQWFIGLSDYTGDRWVWFDGPAPTDDVLTIDSFAPYLFPGTGDLAMVVAVGCPFDAELSRVTFGAPEMRGTGGGDYPLQVDALDTMSPPLSDSELPPSYELPANGFPPIGNQGNTQFCTSYSTAYGALSFQLRRLYGPEWRAFEFPLFWCSPTWTHLGTDDGTQFDVGRYPETVLDYLKNTGAAVTEHVKNENVRNPAWDLTQCQADAEAIKIADWQKVAVKGDKGIRNVQSILRAEKRPVIFWINLDTTFPGAKGGVYVLPNSPVWTGGAHTMLIVGYDDNLQAFKVRNSWGRDWHDNGYMWFGYQNFRNDNFTINAFTLSIEYDEAVAQRFFSGPSVVPVSNVRASDGTSSSSILVEWTAAPGAAKYEIYRNGFTAPIAQIDDPAVTSWKDETIPLGDTSGYAYGVVAINAGGGRSPEMTDRGYLKLDETLDPDILSVDIQGTPLRTQQGARFTAVTEPLHEGVAYELDWNFNGGVEGGFEVNGGTVDVTFTDPGDYTLELTLSSPYGSDIYVLPYTVLPEDNAPLAVLSPIPNSPRNTPLTFNGGGSTAAAERWVAAWQWDLDNNGSFEFTTTGPTMDQMYQNKGYQTVRMRVLDNLNVLSAPVEETFLVAGIWHEQVIEYGGIRLSMTRLADGRPAIIHSSGADTRYGYPSDLLGNGAWNMQTVKTDDGSNYYVTNMKLVTANGAPVIMLRANSTAGRLDVLSTADPLGAGGWVSSEVLFDDDDSDLKTSEAYDPDILGNVNSAGDPSTIVIAYQETDDIRLDANANYDIKVALGTTDGSGGYSFSHQTAIPDPTPDWGAHAVNYPQLARINGIPAMLYNDSPYGLWYRDAYYAYASDAQGGGWVGGIAVPDLNGFNNGSNRSIFDANGHVAFSANYDHGTAQYIMTYLVSDSPGPQLGNLTKLTFPGTEGSTVNGGFTSSAGVPVLMSGIPGASVYPAGWGFLESSTPQGTQVEDWDRASGMTNWAANVVGIELGDGSYALAYYDSPATDRKVRYTVYY